eukprot:648070-Prymnesium_polylepis.1
MATASARTTVQPIGRVAMASCTMSAGARVSRRPQPQAIFSAMRTTVWAKGSTIVRWTDQSAVGLCTMFGGGRASLRRWELPLPPHQCRAPRIMATAATMRVPPTRRTASISCTTCGGGRAANRPSERRSHAPPIMAVPRRLQASLARRTRPHVSASCTTSSGGGAARSAP